MRASTVLPARQNSARKTVGMSDNSLREMFSENPDKFLVGVVDVTTLEDPNGVQLFLMPCREKYFVRQSVYNDSRPNVSYHTLPENDPVNLKEYLSSLKCESRFGIEEHGINKKDFAKNFHNKKEVPWILSKFSSIDYPCDHFFSAHDLLLECCGITEPENESFSSDEAHIANNQKKANWLPFTVSEQLDPSPGILNDFNGRLQFTFADNNFLYSGFAKMTHIQRFGFLPAIANKLNRLYPEATHGNMPFQGERKGEVGLAIPHVVPPEQNIVEPTTSACFLIKFFCSEYTKKLGLALLVLGIAAMILAGPCGFAAALSGVITVHSISDACLIIGGVLLAGHSFLNHRQAHAPTPPNTAPAIQQRSPIS